MALKLTLDIADINNLQSVLDSKQIKLKPGGSNVTIAADGTLSVLSSGTTSPYTLPAASTTVLGGVKIGTGINLAADGTISVNSSTGGTGEGQLINLPNQTWWKIIQPTNYGKTYSNGTRQGKYFIGGYRDNINVNFSTADREDKVFTLAAYNILLPNGQREFSNEAAWDITIETHYDNPGYTPYGDFEGHLFRTYSTDGQEHRHHSVYVNKTSGGSRQDFEANEMTFNLTQGVGKSPFQYVFFNEGNVQTFSRGGRISGFQAMQLGVTTGIWNVGGTGFLKVPQVIDADGYGKFIAALPVYADNAAAKGAGKPINQWYRDNNGNVKIVI